MAVECGCDILMGTMYYDSINEYCKENNLKYMPFIGKVKENNCRSKYADHSKYLRFKYPDMGDRIFSLQEIIDHFTIPNLSGEVTDPYGFEYLVYMDTAKQLDTIIREILPEILKSWGME